MNWIQRISAVYGRFQDFLRRPAVRRLCAMRKSRWACAIGLGLTLLSLGMTGYALYWLAWPLIWPWYPSAAGWSGDWVWAAMVGIGMVWSLLFLPVGYFNQWLLERGVAQGVRRAIYAALLWFGAALMWWGTLHSNLG